MRLVLQHGGRDVEAVVERRGGLYRVVLAGREYEVDVAALGDGLASLRLDGAQHEVGVEPIRARGAGARGAEARGAEPGAGDRYRVTVGGGGTPEEVVVLDPLAHLARKARGGGGAAGGGTVAALMPGRVVAVLVEEGAEVAAGQGVVVVEAMKMENEIAAEHAGTVARLHVEPGQAVEGGDPLFEIG